MWVLASFLKHGVDFEGEEVPVMSYPDRETVFCAFHFVCGNFYLFASILACVVFASLEHFVKFKGTVSVVDFV